MAASLLPSCDTMVVLAPHTRAGATILAKNSDRSPYECQPLGQLPHCVHPEGATVHCQYLEIAQVAETAAVIGSRPFWLWGFEHGLNQYGVAIGNEAVLTRELLPSTGLLGMDLVRLGLERSRTAREATEIIGALIERWGQGGSAQYDVDFRYCGAFIVADHAEAYVLESSGRQWIACRVEDRACISNRFTIDAGSLGSADVESYARARGWCDGDGESSFDFAAAYSSRNAGKDKSDPLHARGRLTRSRELVSRNGRRTIREMFAILRDHGARGEMPPGGHPSTRDDSPTLCMHGSVSGTTASMVAELPAPDADRLPVLWASLAAPCTSVVFPLFVGGTLPPVLAAGGEKPSADSPWWRFRKIQDLVALAPERLAPIAWKHFRPLEAALLERCAEVSRQARKLEPTAREKLLSSFMTQNIVRILNAQSAAESELMRNAVAR
ncbi:MAG: C69 family dipeptidase [Candidatus Binatus sp.]|uniref:C69 family dipeptidase n=1 Tax=Candidatus Binatus sp. TaxID=2811406 RepID=UPI003BAE85B0